MATSDGISSEDWDVVHDLALKIVNAEADAEANIYTKQLLQYLDGLEAKYGVLPSILATRADYVEDRAEAGRLLRQAYLVAEAAYDTCNMKQIAESLNELRLEEMDSGQCSTILISQQLADEVGNLLSRMNRGYWNSLYWEIMDDGATMLVVVSLEEQHNNRRNILTVCAILRTVMSTLLPSNPQSTTWAASVECQGKRIGGVLGGLGDDWHTLGTYGGIDEDVDHLWDESP